MSNKNNTNKDNDMTNPAPLTLTLATPKLNPYSKRQWGADVYCACCGRGIPRRETAQVVIITHRADEQAESELHVGHGGSGKARQITFAPIPQSVMGRDPVEWGSFVGSHCAKQIAKTHKVSTRRAITAWSKAGCP